MSFATSRAKPNDNIFFSSFQPGVRFTAFDPSLRVICAGVRRPPACINDSTLVPCARVRFGRAVERSRVLSSVICSCAIRIPIPRYTFFTRAIVDVRGTARGGDNWRTVDQVSLSFSNYFNCYRLIFCRYYNYYYYLCAH